MLDQTSRFSPRVTGAVLAFTSRDEAVAKSRGMRERGNQICCRKSAGHFVSC